MTTFPAMKTALLAQLQARPALAAPVVVGRVLPPGGANFYEGVLLSGPTVNTTTQTAYGMGTTTTRYQEDYVTTIFITVLHPGTDGATTEDRAFALMAEVEAQVATDPSINGTLGPGGTALLDGYDAGNRMDATQRETQIDMRLRCIAFID